MENLIENLNGESDWESKWRISREYFNEIISRFSRITDFYQDYLDLGLVQVIVSLITCWNLDKIYIRPTPKLKDPNIY